MGETPKLQFMQIHDGIEGLKHLPNGLALSFGNFDGLHLGHRKIIELAKSLRSPAGIAIATFEPHPLTVLRPGHAPPRLTPLPLKLELLKEIGIDHVAILPPTTSLLNLSAEEFWRILCDDVRPAHLIEGHSFNFGKNRGGNIDRLREWTDGSEVKLHIIDEVEVPLLDLKIAPVSSSLIRWLIVGGRVRDAAICLGKPYTLQGLVVKGFQRGRTIGVPTANLDCGEQLLPAEGVYAGRCKIKDTEYPAAISIGRLPTFGDDQLQIEAHLIGFTGDLYGQTLHVELIDWIREQQKFFGIDALKKQLAKDIDWSKSRSGLDATRAIANIIAE
jgi:riboflavin kinase/FMN adenylyltransferase